jgi:hypothetical protein
VGAGCERVGEERKQKQSAVTHVILTCDMYKSSLRHIHDPVLSSLELKGILSYFLDFVLRIIFQETLCFASRLYFRLQAKGSPKLVDTLNRAMLNHAAP